MEKAFRNASNANAVFWCLSPTMGARVRQSCTKRGCAQILNVATTFESTMAISVRGERSKNQKNDLHFELQLHNLQLLPLHGRLQVLLSNCLPRDL